MRTLVSTKAFAKVNFNLKVLPLKEDGFHDIESIFQTVSIFDTVSVEVKDDDGCEVFCNSMVLPKKNTITASYEAFCHICGVKVPGVKVILEKGIPSGGGLGGGSSDAAAFVRLLQKICNIKLNESQLDYIAEKTGSDVFFFMHCDEEGKGSALVSGRGQKIKKIETRKDLYLLLVFPGLESNTKEAYSKVDAYLANGDSLNYPDFGQLESIYRAAPEEWMFNNTFYPALKDSLPELKLALDDLKKTGANYAALSGSGSTVFGVYTSLETAEKAKVMVSKAWKVQLVQTI